MESFISIQDLSLIMGVKLKTFLAVLLFCAPVFAEHYSIVFIHIGKEIPSYAEIALSQAKKFNPNASVILLANEEAAESFSQKFPELEVEYIACESLIKTQSHQNFLERTTLDRESGEGFWLYTSERFLYLDDLMTQYKMQDVFHLEYDNMLYVNLEELLPIFQHYYPGIAATFDNDDRCIPGFIYIANEQAMHSLAKSFALHASKSLNDMQLIALYKNENGNDKISHLPIITKEYANVYPLVSSSGHTAQNPSQYTQNIEVFHSIFDAAALGQFLGGISPRNGVAKPGFINESCLFNPSLLNIVWIPDARLGNIPYIIYPHATYRINSLHIHSKNLGDFR